MRTFFATISLKAALIGKLTHWADGPDMVQRTATIPHISDGHINFMVSQIIRAIGAAAPHELRAKVHAHALRAYEIASHNMHAEMTADDDYPLCPLTWQEIISLLLKHHVINPPPPPDPGPDWKMQEEVLKTISSEAAQLFERTLEKFGYNMQAVYAENLRILASLTSSREINHETRGLALSFMATSGVAESIIADFEEKCGTTHPRHIGPKGPKTWASTMGN